MDCTKKISTLMNNYKLDRRLNLDRGRNSELLYYPSIPVPSVSESYIVLFPTLHSAF